jgi:hypothetical protein
VGKSIAANLNRVLLGVCVLPVSVTAGLIDRGDGLIYDSVLDITWLQDVNYASTSSYAETNKNPDGTPNQILEDGRMGWQAATAWADQLVFGGFDDWRLPTVMPISGDAFDRTPTDDATSDRGYALTTTGGSNGGWRDESGTPVSELGHMWYVNLENVAKSSDINTGPFSNLDFVAGTDKGSFWTGTETSTSATAARFNVNAGGFQGLDAGQDNPFFAWAVRDGDVEAGEDGEGTNTVPAPATVFLLLCGLLGLGFARRGELSTGGQ